MVALRSDRRDRSLVVVLWVLTLAVLGTGIASVNPILIFWGALGVAGSVFLTRIHVRDTGATAGAGAGVGAEPIAAGAGALGPGVPGADAPGADAPSAHATGTGTPGAAEAEVGSEVGEESSR